jgi:hypothetical protein
MSVINEREKKLHIYDWVPNDMVIPEGTVLAGTPEASYKLSKQQITAENFETLALDIKLFNQEEDYFKLQNKWLKEFDIFLQKYIPIACKHQIAFASSNYLRLKYLFDSAYLETRLAQLIVEEYRPIEINYFSKPHPVTDSVFEFLKTGGKFFFLEALKALSQKYKIRLNIVFETLAKEAPAVSIYSPKLPRQVKIIAKKIQFFLKYNKSIFPGKNKKRGCLFLHAGSADVDEVIRYSIHKGQQVFTLDHYGIYKETAFRDFYPYPQINDRSLSFKSECQKALIALINSPFGFYEFYNEECSEIVFQLIKPFIVLFIEKDLCYILERMEVYSQALRQLNIGIVYARGNTDIESISILLAARHLIGIKTVCLQHASSCLLSASMSVYDINTYDRTLSRDSVSESSILEAWDRQDEPVSRNELKVSPHYSNWLQKNIPKESRCKKKRLRILYVEKKFAGHLRGFNESTYSLNQYYEFQKSILSFLAKNNSFDFVYKHAEGQEWAEKSLLKDIDDLKASHIRISRCSFIKELKNADAVIVDYPSGSLFEAIIARVPVVCLYPKHFQITKKATQTFGTILQPFENMEQALMIIDNFLKAKVCWSNYQAFLSVTDDVDFIFESMFF